MYLPTVVPCVENGTTGPGYTWSQTSGEVVVVIPVPAGTNGKNVLVDIKKWSLSVGIACADEKLVDGRLHAAVSPNDSVWGVDPVDGKVTVQLGKVVDDWWACAIEGHQTIDVLDIEPPQNMLGVAEKKWPPADLE